jgi:GNAT superfamily N-acetyltransferase
MSQNSRSIVSIRKFVADDAGRISALFRAVYGDHYVYPDVYLPSMICRHNEQERWQSSVAFFDGEMVGHAVLWMDPDSPGSAEFALTVVHPAARGLGIATRLGRHLCEQARELGLRWLTIKQVSSHMHSQRLAQTLGFHTTALLLDYVASPFGNESRESVVLGCLPLQPCPIPSLSWPHACLDWIAPIERHFGNSPEACNRSDTPIIVSTQEQRVEVTLNELDPDRLDEVARIPEGRLVYLKLRLNQRTPAAMQQMRRASFVHAGLMPSLDQSWYGVMQRGYRVNQLDLHCPISRKLYQASRRPCLAQES